MDEKDILIQQLRSELAKAQKNMQGLTDDHKVAYKENQKSNKVSLNGNKELQVPIEELETSEEELRSTIVELITVNQALYKSNEELYSNRKFGNAMIALMHEPLLLLDKKFIIKSANNSFYKNFQLTENETLGKILFELKNSSWNIPGLRVELEKIHKEKKKMRELEMTFIFPVIGLRTICFNIQPIIRENGEQFILLALEDITDRKNTELVLEESANKVIKERELLLNFFMQTPAMFFTLKGPDLIFEFTNPLFCSYAGNRVLIGRKLLDAIPELEDQGYPAILNKVYLTGDPFTGKGLPLFLENNNGESGQLFVDLNYQATRDVEGAIEGILVFAYDVTEQIKARKQMELNAEMINNLYMNAPAFVATLMGPTHIFTLVNPSYQKLFGSRIIVGKPIMEALPELKGQGFDILLTQVFETGETYVGNEILITLAHDEDLLPEDRYFNFSYQPIYQADTEIDGVLAFGYEVTEEIRGRKVQEASATRFKIMADSMPQKVWTADSLGNINYFNDKWLEYTNKSFEELRDWGWGNIIHPDELEVNQKIWEHSLETGEDFNIEHRYLRFDGTYRWHLSQTIAQRDHNGKIIMWLGTNTDIHEQKLFAKELEKQIAERIKIEKQKNDFISMASHELKTPVTSIKGYTQALQYKFKNEGNTIAETFLLKMDKQINKLTSLINDLLDSSKVTGGQLKFNEEFFDFNELVLEILDEMQITSKRHRISTFLDSTKMIFGDRNRIGQVITNMLSNAIKYSPKANSIRITSKNQDENLKFCVQDFGIGIPKENQKYVFDQFFRVSGVIHDTFAGLGLGLFISSEIIKRHKGMMTVESEEGKGSRFCFTL